MMCCGTLYIDTPSEFLFFLIISFLSKTSTPFYGIVRILTFMPDVTEEEARAILQECGVCVSSIPQHFIQRAQALLNWPNAQCQNIATYIASEASSAHHGLAHSTQQQLETVNAQLRQERELRQNEQKEFKQQLQKQRERHEKECAEFKKREELQQDIRITYTRKENFMASPWQDAECMAERRQYAKEIANSPWLDAQTKNMLAPQIDARDQNMPALERVCTVRTPKKQEYETQPLRMKLKHKRKLSSRPTASR